MLNRLKMKKMDTNENLETSQRKYEEQPKENIIESKSSKKLDSKTILYIIILIFLLILVFLSLFFIFYFKGNNEEKNKNIEMITNSNISQENYIEASYHVTQGKEMILLNQDELKLNEEDYFIEEIQGSYKHILKSLKILDTRNGRYIPEFSGILATKIIFKKNLTSLDGIFKNNEDINKVNLSNFYMNNIVSMNSTFSGCTNLNEINFEGTKINLLVGKFGTNIESKCSNNF